MMWNRPGVDETALLLETAAEAALLLGLPDELVHFYPSSCVSVRGANLTLAKIREEKKLLISIPALSQEFASWLSSFQGDWISDKHLLCCLTHENRLALNRLLPFTCPTAFGRSVATFGTGDRLGLATPAHIDALSGSGVKPILAQQSFRELSLTGRTYPRVLDDVCWAVFQEGYEEGFGADGDHLKQKDQIQGALECGYTMITLDCSEQIGRGLDQLDGVEILERFALLPSEYRLRLEAQYLGRAFPAGGYQFHFSMVELAHCALTYRQAIEFAEEVYKELILNCEHSVDFELSVDETESITTAQGHLFVVSELLDRQVQVTSLAPRFIGEFQKGIDYLGELDQFERQLKEHAAIADQYGHKLSIHSGSDKFSVFSMIGKATNGRYHLKTSGTTWLEAVAAIALCHPELFRRMYRMALAHFEEAKALYHVSADLTQMPDVGSIKDDDLILCLENVHSRQLLHITYGWQLQESDLGPEIQTTLMRHEDLFLDRVRNHISHHVQLLRNVE